MYKKKQVLTIEKQGPEPSLPSSLPDYTSSDILLKPPPSSRMSSVFSSEIVIMELCVLAGIVPLVYLDPQGQKGVMRH